MEKLKSYFVGIVLALLIIHPAIDYSIPVIVNSPLWLYFTVVSAFFGIFLWWQDLHIILKILSTYLFMNCFTSQVPFLAFNAYILVVATFYFYILIKKCDFLIIVKFLEAAFWLQVILTGFQLMGMDKLMNFGQETPVFYGTVLQYMRYASLLAILTPFLIIKSGWYLIPVFILCLISQSSSFALSLIAGVFTYYFIRKFQFEITWNSGRTSIFGRRWLVFIFLIITAGYAAYDWGSFRGAIIPSNGGRLLSWWAVIQTWVLDTAKSPMQVNLIGPFKWSWMMFGHGMDTFLPLFPVYKHDANPFPQAHNSWLQLLWEIGMVGFSLIVAYCVSLIRRLYKVKAYLMVAGAVIIAVNMFFAFPDRMMQTILLLVAYPALCEKHLSLKIKNNPC